MADASYDAVIVGGGNKGLVTAMYLAKYGGMKVGIFEKRYELGGGWSSEDGPAPGFLCDRHMTMVGGIGYDVYFKLLAEDFPEFFTQGCRFIPWTISKGFIFGEDNSCVVVYPRETDPRQERTAETMARFSPRDAETFMRLVERWTEPLYEATMESFWNPPPPIGVHDPVEKLLLDPKMEVDPTWFVKSSIEVLKDIFESEALIAGFIRGTYSAIAIPPDMYATGIGQFVSLLGTQGLSPRGCIEGGDHQLAHAAQRILLEHGAEMFTNKEVDRVIIENGKAGGIRLVDGTEIEAKKLVVSNLDPYTLCFRLVGEEHFSPQVLKRIQNLARDNQSVCWYSWALHEAPKYKAAELYPDINRTGVLYLTSKDPEALIRERAYLKLGKMSPELNMMAGCHTLQDKMEAPEGKHVALTEQYTLPAHRMTEKEWVEYKPVHAEQVISAWQRYAPNMTWDNVIGYSPETPLDICHLDNMAPPGNWSIIDHTPSQMGKFRPIPEFARHRIPPIGNLYGTGAAWHPGGGGFACQGYNCYKIIAEDFGLRKPWEEGGRPY